MKVENLFFFFYFLPYRIIFSYATFATNKKHLEKIRSIRRKEQIILSPRCAFTLAIFVTDDVAMERSRFVNDKGGRIKC